MAGQPVIAANAPTAQPNELAMLMQGYSPATAISAQRSQYLAQALAAMRGEGQNIRTPVALGSDLLAQALLQRKYGQSMQDFATAARGDQQQMAAPAASWLDQQSGAQQAPAGPTPDASTPPPPPTPQNTAPAQPAPDYAPNFGDPHQDPGAFFAAALGGKPVSITSGLRTPEHNRAVGGSPTSSHLTGNAWDFTVPGMSSAQAVDALRQSGMPFDQIIDEGRDVHVGMDPRMRGMVMAGNGGHYSVVDRDTFGTPQPAPAGMTPGRAQTPGGQPTYSPDGQPGPLQPGSAPQSVPSPSPSPGAVQSSPGGMASAPPAAASPAAGGASAPALYHQPVAPEEIALARQLLSSPRTYQQGIAYVESLRERTAAPVKPEMSISREGQVLSGNPWNPTQPNPAASIPGWRGPQPAGWTYDANGKAVPTDSVKYGAPQQIPGTNQLGQTGPGGKLEAGPQLDFGPSQRADLQGKLYGSPVWEKFSEARSALQGFRNTVGQMAGLNNGVLDTAAIDSYLRGINPGASARNTTVQMFLEHLGLPQELQGMVLSVTGNGYLTPQTLQKMDQAMQSYTAAHAAEVQTIHRGHVALAQQYGVDEKGLGEDIGDIPQPQTLRFGGAPSPGQAGASAAQTARTAGGSIANAAANLPRLSPQQAAALPAGTRFIGLDGKPRTRK